jgi:hypothetical protein
MHEMWQQSAASGVKLIIRKQCSTQVLDSVFGSLVWNLCCLIQWFKYYEFLQFPYSLLHEFQFYTYRFLLVISLTLHSLQV